MDGEEDGWRPLRRPGRPPTVDLGASPFARLAAAHALAVAGDTLVTTALAGSLFFDISPGAARGRVALSLVLSMAPFAVVAPFLGPAVDRVQGGRRAVMVTVAVARAVTCLSMARVLHGLLLFPAAFAALVLAKTHSVTKSALVPAVVDSEEELVEANSKLALIGVVMGLLAAGPAVAILKLAGPEWVVRVAAVLFGASAVAATRIVVRRRPEAEGASDDAAGGLPGADSVARAAGIVRASVAMAALRGSVGFLTFLVAFALRRESAPSWVFGAALLASMVGSLAGSVVAPVLRRALREERLLVAALAVLGLGGLLATRVSGRMGAAVLAAAVGLAAAGGRLAFDAVVQRDSPHAVHGQAFARFEAMFQLVWVAGALVPVVLAIPLQAGFGVLAVVGLAGAVGYAVQDR